jgi:hypothetical protein
MRRWTPRRGARCAPATEQGGSVRYRTKSAAAARACGGDPSSLGGTLRRAAPARSARGADPGRRPWVRCPPLRDGARRTRAVAREQDSVRTRDHWMRGAGVTSASLAGSMRDRPRAGGGRRRTAAGADHPTKCWAADQVGPPTQGRVRHCGWPPIVASEPPGSRAMPMNPGPPERRQAPRSGGWTAPIPPPAAGATGATQNRRGGWLPQGRLQPRLAAPPRPPVTSRPGLARHARIAWQATAPP